MGSRDRVCVAAAAAIAIVTAQAAVAGPSIVSAPAKGAAATAPIVPVVVFGEDARRTLPQFADEHHLDERDLGRSHAASGLIRCGNAHGAGQLTLTDDVITTAAHVFYDENGMLRAPVCSFDFALNGVETHVAVDLTTVVAGSIKPYDVEVTRDWAVARLSHAISGVKPYGLATDIHDDEPTAFVARGHIDWGEGRRLSMQTCTLHNKLSDGAEGTREFSFDCDTGDGASGGALMFDHDMTRMGAILVGWRSNHPFRAMPFSHNHYNFAVTVEGAFRKAVYAAANKLVVQK